MVRRTPKARFCSDECRIAYFRNRPREQGGRSAAEGRVACRICGVERHLLYRHLASAHGIDSREYRRRFPYAERVSENYRVISRDRKLDEQGAPYWTAARIVRWLQRETAATGRVPSSTECRARAIEQLAFSRRGRRAPSLATIVAAFGSFNGALAAAGLPTGTRYGSGKRKLCKRGHPLTGKNVLLHPDGRRSCRTCYRLYHREYKRRKKQIPPDRWRLQ